MRIRVREVFLKKTFIIFAIANSLVLIWAFGTMIYTSICHYRRSALVSFIRQEVGFDTIGLFSIFIASGALIVGSCVGILGAFFHFPLVFNSYRSFLAASLSLKIFAVLWSSLLHPNPIFPNYLKLFEVESLYFHQPSGFSTMWNKRISFWNDLQSQLKCCGVHDFQDWIHSSCKCVPHSCCKPSVLAQCRRTLSNPFNVITANDIANIKKVIYPTDCTTALRRGMHDLQTFLVMYAMVILIVELIFYTICSHLLKLIEHHVKKVRREESDFDGKFGIWLLEPSDTVFGGIAALDKGPNGIGRLDVSPVLSSAKKTPDDKKEAPTDGVKQLF